MRIHNILFYLAAVFLILAGNRNLWNKLTEERKKEKLLREQQNIVIGDKSFEVQKLAYDESSKKLRNTSVYIQTVRISNQDLNKKNNPTTQVETGNVAENASQSK